MYIYIYIHIHIIAVLGSFIGKIGAQVTLGRATYTKAMKALSVRPFCGCFLTGRGPFRVPLKRSIMDPSNVRLQDSQSKDLGLSGLGCLGG